MVWTIELSVSTQAARLGATNHGGDGAVPGIDAPCRDPAIPWYYSQAGNCADFDEYLVIDVTTKDDDVSSTTEYRLNVECISSDSNQKGYYGEYFVWTDAWASDGNDYFNSTSTYAGNTEAGQGYAAFIYGNSGDIFSGETNIIDEAAFKTENDWKLTYRITGYICDGSGGTTAVSTTTDITLECKARYPDFHAGHPAALSEAGTNNQSTAGGGSRVTMGINALVGSINGPTGLPLDTNVEIPCGGEVEWEVEVEYVNDVWGRPMAVVGGGLQFAWIASGVTTAVDGFEFEELTGSTTTLTITRSADEGNSFIGVCVSGCSEEMLPHGYGSLTVGSSRNDAGFTYTVSLETCPKSGSPCWKSKSIQNKVKHPFRPYRP